MALKNQAITVCYVAWNTSTNAGQTGDAGNHTLKLVQDGTEAAPTNTPTEVDSTNMKGVYKLALTAADMNFNCVVLGGVSSTANVSIIPIVIVTERGVLPTVAPGAAAGFIVAGSGTNQLSPVSGGVNVTQVNAVATSSVTTVNANVGTTQPTNFTGTGAAALVKADTEDWGGVAVGGMPNSTTPPTTAAIATAIWTDATAGDFTVASSIGKSLYTSGVVPGAAGGLFIAGSNAATTVNFTGNLSGSVGSVTGAVGSVTGAVGSVTAAVTITMSQVLAAPRALDSIADGSMQLNDALWAAIGVGVGQEDASTGTSMTVKTPSTATTLRTFTLTTVAGTPANYVTKRV